MNPENLASRELVVSKPTKEELLAAQTEIAKVYLTAVLELLNLQGHGELNFAKTSFTTPEGGTYLLQVAHVDGPKIDCQNLKSLE